jgi:uncharacterized metal-binding protein YceD (DUF177 family)
LILSKKRVLTGGDVAIGFELMKVPITDIPPEGKDFVFELSKELINARLHETRQSKGAMSAPAYSFSDHPSVHFHLELEGRTVTIDGDVAGKFQASCSRCVDETTQNMNAPVSLVLKPHSERRRPEDEVEDLNIGFYDGKEVDCASIAEEYLVLAIPYSVLCSPSCKGLCSHCGENLNQSQCACAPQSDSSSPLSALKHLKLTN